MATKLLLLSDTHLPKRAKVLPEILWADIEAADIVVHAGDWVNEELLDQLQSRSRRLIACYGNNDGAGLRARLPLVARAVVEDVRLAVVHETGPAAKRGERMDAEFPETDLLVFGHSHIPWDSVTPGGMRLLNPGSPTDRRRQPFCTYLRVEIDGKTVTPDLRRLPPRETGRS
ncbi:MULTISPECIES: metallophosphoesterase [unclassified Arthrobacter]|uniref:metallophosphoesterase family protein n=1 Tax=unclassified Arthrobacter TaxID=235627 RepID=UPI001E49890D|nr:MULTISPECIES: metallophosphoesterase [unclassified Arthrobacter]MCC9144135.1 metallophosphoesterase [Arthrobacter sp. zg-Y919]MDK1275360.1 metallophosphoesterase [Arthrobacter sp. zg.Y919]WIB03252.1 metallophosphoesterase [Arthrobacter sp. zg-Y919]